MSEPTVHDIASVANLKKLIEELEELELRRQQAEAGDELSQLVEAERKDMTDRELRAIIETEGLAGEAADIALRCCQKVRGEDTRVTVSGIIIFSNGDIAAFDSGGHQIPELQKSSIVDLLKKHASAMGYSLDGCKISSDFKGWIVPEVVIDNG